MFQVFHLGVSNVAIAIYACCKRMFQVFQLFHMYVLSVSSGCYRSISRCCRTCMFQVYVFKCSKCFKRMLQVFHLDVAKVNLDVAYGYKCMFQVYVSFAFRRMFQVFYLDVSKVDLVEHMLQWSQWLAACRSRLLLLLERRRGSPCGCLRPADAFMARIRRRGQVTGIGPMCMRARETERAFCGRA
jgi:hypothetical protein